MNGSSLDKLFMIFTKYLFILLVFYGIGMMVVVIAGKDNLALKLINTWSSMFGALVGLGSGYLLGKARGSDHPPPVQKEDNGIRSSE